MKKIIALFSTLSLVVTPIGTIVSCTNSKPDYDSLFDNPNGNNGGEYLPQSIKEVINNFNNLTSKTYITELDIVSQNSELIKKDLISKVSGEITLDTEIFKIKASDNNNFTMPSLDNYNQGAMTNEKVEQLVGKFDISLFYYDQVVSTQSFVYTSSILEVYRNIINLLNQDSLANSNFGQVQQLDIELFNVPVVGKISFGVLFNLVKTLNSFATALPGLKDLINQINQIGNLDLKSLEEYNEETYKNFDSSFVEYFEKLMDSISKLLKTFGIDDTFKLPLGDKEVTIKISELLNTNVLELLGLDLSGLNSDMINIEIGDESGKDCITIMDILRNIEPFVVEIVKMIFDTKTPSYFTESHNLLYSLLKYLTKDMDENDSITKIFRQNFDRNQASLSYSSATTNIDILCYNALVGYDKNRKDKNFYIKMTAVLNIDDIEMSSALKWIIKGLVGDKLTLLNNKNLSEVLNLIQITPSNIIQSIIRNFYSKQKDGYFKLDDLIISNDMDLKFFEDIDAKGLIDGVKELEGKEFVKDFAIALGGTLKEKALPIVNEKINAIIPKVSIKPIIDLLEQKIIYSLGKNKELLDNADIKIMDAKYTYAFRRNENTNNELQEWEQPTGLALSKLIEYRSCKLVFRNVQYKIVSKSNKDLWTLSRNDIAFDVVFSDYDIPKNSK
ncbi:hypothetical protein SLITO_v1c08630 [Spiroplasma litorale]|uniref:MOLPALP family lipoprotein n=1 Tax=Spiroplasma litorale TaxID=216942 RepID=A0A0K1W2S6_9MOLU|nr:hypothetical protein [Spiroplasma litorale]AKX34478.1 hypothetical protein SLITO_v1c08630 [Spiroplasma litorale]